MPAFQHAIDLGYCYLETDVHATSDGVLVAFHDDSLDRVTNMTGQIRDLPWSQVRQAQIDGSETIPLMADLLSSFPAARINIDVKAKHSVEPLAKLIADTGSVDRVCVGSFSDSRLKGIRDLVGPRLCTSLGPLGITALRAASFGVPSPSFTGNGSFLSAACAQVPIAMKGVSITDQRFIDAAHRRGLQVHVWTIDSPEQMNELLDQGVDGIMTDEPKVLKDVLTTRQSWVE